jgi:hypothetical protein
MGNYPIHIITRIQFLVPLTTRCIIHHAQGLTFDHLAFDLVNVINMVSHTQHYFIFIHKNILIYFPHYQKKKFM